MGSRPSAFQRLCPICQIEHIKSYGATRCDRCHRWPGWHQQPAPELIPCADEGTGPYDAAVNVLRAALEEGESRYRGPAAPRPDAREQRIAVMADPHFPFVSRAALGLAFAETAGADRLVVAGDTMDSYAVSRFIKYRHVSILEEVAAVKAFLEEASSRYPHVLIIEGNHDRLRLEKQIRARCADDELMAALEVLTDGNFSLVRAASRNLPNVEFAVQEVGGFRVRWFAQIGDCLITHAEKYSRVPVSATRQIEEWFSDQEQMLGLQPWRVLIQAHTHQLSRVPWRADKLLMEAGCLCETHGYQLDARVSGRPQRLGYVTLTQHDGKTDINSCREHWLDDAVRG